LTKTSGTPSPGFSTRVHLFSLAFANLRFEKSLFFGSSKCLKIEVSTKFKVNKKMFFQLKEKEREEREGEREREIERDRERQRER
jgi:hypothetical protein